VCGIRSHLEYKAGDHLHRDVIDAFERMKKSAPLEMWVVHDRRSDGYIAQKWQRDELGFRSCADRLKAASIEALRASLPPGLMRHEREPGDAASIVEIWV